MRFGWNLIRWNGAEERLNFLPEPELSRAEQGYDTFTGEAQSRADTHPGNWSRISLGKPSPARIELLHWQNLSLEQGCKMLHLLWPVVFLGSQVPGSLSIWAPDHTFSFFVWLLWLKSQVVGSELPWLIPDFRRNILLTKMMLHMGQVFTVFIILRYSPSITISSELLS